MSSFFKKRNTSQPRGKMKYQVQDETYRDVFDERDRIKSPRRKSMPKKPTYILAGICTFISSILLFLIIPVPFKVIRDIVQLSKGKYSLAYWKFLRRFYFGHGFHITLRLFLFLLILTTICGCIIFFFAYRNYLVQNARNDNSDLNSHEGDSELMQPEELPVKFDIFPDAGMHSRNVNATAVISHIMLNNSGLKKIEMVDRDDDDQIIVDDEGYASVSRLKPIDTKFGQSLFNSVDLPHDKEIRHFYSPKDLLYNPNHVGWKDDYETIAEKINNDWYMPDYELQRPGGMYVVDTSPANTMVIAETRAGKGQRLVEPTIDMWLRSDDRDNIMTNDSKGELTLKFFYPAKRRGWNVFIFNLIDETKTNIYNMLGYAVEAAIRGDIVKVEQHVKDIGDIFFPEAKGENPLWQNGANTAFQRSALGLIDFYLEEDQEIRYQAQKEGWSFSRLNQKLDELWGHVTPYNTYQMMTNLAAKISQNSSAIHIPQDNDSYYPKLTGDKGTVVENKKTKVRNTVFDFATSKDYLTLFFDATAALPQNTLRSAVANQNNALRSMAKSDKTISSIYGISLVAMKFFTDSIIARLTSGRPSQNLDIVGLSFPRRIAVRIERNYLIFHSLRGKKIHWRAYEDPEMTKQLDPEVFDYTNVVDVSGWATYVTKGIFPSRVVYLRLDIIEQASKLPLKTFRFKFTKEFQKSLNGRTYVIDSVSKEKVIKNGSLDEYRLVYLKDKQGNVLKEKGLQVKYGYSRFKKRHVSLQDDDWHENGTRTVNVQKLNIISQINIHYTEKPMFISFITPPHLRNYSKIILMAINQMFNLQAGSAYMTLPNQKPYYKTKYMLDEVGNLQSRGQGIPVLQQKMSIGLGQDQSFTLILQTLQQLIDIYGESVEKILQGNTSNFIYLKSKDDSLLSVLEGLSGIRHNSYLDSKNVQYDLRKVINPTDGKITEVTSIKEVPVIRKNDMLLVSKADSMIFGQGRPIWNRNQVALPFAYALHKKQLRDLDSEDQISLSTLPTNDNSLDFDLLGNQPNFMRMLQKRVAQAKLAPKMIYRYRMAHGKNGEMLTDDELAKLDQDEVAKEIMYEINKELRSQKQAEKQQEQNDQAQQTTPTEKTSKKQPPTSENFIINQMKAATNARKQTEEALENYQQNTEFKQSFAETSAEDEQNKSKIYAENRVSKFDVLNGYVDDEIIKAVNEIRPDINHNGKSYGMYFDPNGNLIGLNNQVFLQRNDSIDLVTNMKDKITVIPGNGKDNGDSDYIVTESFQEYLTSLTSWAELFGGKFQKEFIRAYDQQERGNLD